MRRMTDEGLAAAPMPADDQPMRRRLTDPQLGRARQLRRNMTVAEILMWRALRDRRIGVKFRRQVPIGPYIADFVCIDAQLVVELDGVTHEQPGRQIYDAGRDKWLRAQGWHILRFSNDLVTGGTDIVVAQIREIVAPGGPHPSRSA
jgi:very-short-patch-repair endonuclease